MKSNGCLSDGGCPVISDDKVAKATNIVDLMCKGLRD